MPKGKSTCEKCHQSFNSSIIAKHRLACANGKPAVKVADDATITRALALALQFHRLPLSPASREKISKVAAEVVNSET